MKKITYIVLFIFALSFLTACGNETVVEESVEYLKGCGRYSLKEIVNNYFIDPTWKTLTNSSGNRVYQVSGNTYYKGKLSFFDFEITMEEKEGKLTRVQIDKEEVSNDSFIRDICYKTTIKKTGITEIIELPVKVNYDEYAYVLNGDIPKNVKVTITGEDFRMEKLQEGNFKDLTAVLDFTSYKPFDTPQKIYFSLSEDLEDFLYRIEPISVDVILEDLVSEVRTVEVTQVNADNSNFTATLLSADRHDAVVRGSKTELSKIHSVRAVVDFSLIDFSEGKHQVNNVLLQAYDINGNVLETVTVAPSTVTVDMMIVKK